MLAGTNECINSYLVFNFVVVITLFTFLPLLPALHTFLEVFIETELSKLGKNHYFDMNISTILSVPCTYCM